MSDFKDRLWQEIVDRHGSELGRLPGARASRRRKRELLAGTTIAAGIVAAVAVLALGGSGAVTPAYAVTSNRDGTVTLRIAQLAGLPRANARLAALGVRAVAVPALAACAPPKALPSFHAAHRPTLRALPSPWPPAAAMKISPARIPLGETLVLAARRSHGRIKLLPAALVHGRAPGCVAALAAPPRAIAITPAALRARLSECQRLARHRGGLAPRVLKIPGRRLRRLAAAPAPLLSAVAISCAAAPVAAIGSSRPPAKIAPAGNS